MSPIRRPRNRQSLTPRRSCIVLPLLAKRLILSFSLQNRSLREESRQEVVKAETQTAPDAEKGWSRRRHASRQSSDGVRHKAINALPVGCTGETPPRRGSVHEAAQGGGSCNFMKSLRWKTMKSLRWKTMGP